MILKDADKIKEAIQNSDDFVGGSDDIIKVIDSVPEVVISTDTDTISRKAAIDALKNDMASLDHIIKGMSANDVRLDAYVSQRNQVNYDIYTINNLPPAQPEQLGTNLAEVGTDCISRQAAIDICRAPHMRNADCSDFEMAIMMLPPAQPAPSQVAADIARIVENGQDMRVIAQPGRIKGRWIYHPEIGWGETWLCDQCGEKTSSTVIGKPRANFCPNCGADMREVTT